MKETSENLRRYWITGIYLVYILLLFYFAVISRSSDGNFHIQTDIFWSYINTNDYIRKDNYINVLVFIPLGFLTGLVTKRFLLIKTILLGLLVSETIECCQLIFKRGTFDVVDIINNTTGAIVGAVIWFIINKSILMVKKRKH